MPKVQISAKLDRELLEQVKQLEENRTKAIEEGLKLYIQAYTRRDKGDINGNTNGITNGDTGASEQLLKRRRHRDGEPDIPFFNLLIPLFFSTHI